MSASAPCQVDVTPQNLPSLEDELATRKHRLTRTRDELQVQFLAYANELDCVEALERALRSARPVR
ncbi:hypothetical protein [Pseudomonas oryzihabitans]|uniref:hypothetical protein n=1 Tax=Pseudomonas oryzihabitans TaxID=47885 RepID=UPI0011A8AA36|nr:hypothetical protein [Pseudomonas psychrotolerans]